MAMLTKEIYSQYRWDWSKCPVPQMPPIPEGQEPFTGTANQFWTQNIASAPVDEARTARLAEYDVPISSSAGAKPWQGSSYGMPYNMVDTTAPRTMVWNRSRPITWNWFTPTFPWERIPLPPDSQPTRREGDPVGSSDQHYYGVDLTNRRLVEVIQLDKNLLKIWFLGYDGGGRGFAEWDTSKQWDAPGQPRGVVATSVPQFPMFPRWEEIQRGEIRHALFGVLPNYSPEITGAARASDGTWPGHPVRGGERLRLKWSRVLDFAPGTTARIIAEALHFYGWFQGDRNAHGGVPTTGRGGFALTLDSRWAQGDEQHDALGQFELRLTDFEVVTV